MSLQKPSHGARASSTAISIERSPRSVVHPAADEVKVAELKRRKLVLKDEIAKLRSETLH